MMLRDWNKRKTETKKETQGQVALERIRAQKSQKITIYMMHGRNAHMMHALMH